jgi:RHS repeat-associated protein
MWRGRASRRLASTVLATAVISGSLAAVNATPGFALGPNAIVSGFNANSFPGNDDGSTPVTLPFPINFFGTTYNSAWLNNNGNLTFGGALGIYTPYPLIQQGLPIIASFFADVDTRSGSTVTYGTGTVNGHNAIGFNWPGVGCYSLNASVLNYFQLILVDRSDIASGDFDVENNYDQIQWDSGQASGGDANCLNGTAARIGFASGGGGAGSYFELNGSGTNNAFLDSNPTVGLVHNSYGSSQLGRYLFSFRGGLPPIVQPAGGINSSNVAGPNDPAVANQCRSCVGGPVDTSTGNQFVTRSDMSIPGRGIPLNVSETYNSTFASTAGPLGNGWTWSYGVALTNPDGSALGALPTSVVLHAEAGAQDTFNLSGTTWSPATPRVDAPLTHNVDGTWTVLRRGTEKLVFNATGQLTAETDLNGQTTALAYPTKSQTTITDPGGRKLTVSLDSTKKPPRITQIVDNAARKVLFTYDNSGNLISVTDVNGGITSYGYDASHHLVEERSPRYYATGSLPAVPSNCSGTPPANITTSLYDTNGRVICQWDPDGRKTSFAWVGDGLSDGMVNQSTVTDPKGNTTIYNYTYGELTSKTRASGTPSAATWIYRYDPNTLGLTWTRDPNGNVTTATYDSRGNRISSTDPLSRTTNWTYNAYDEISSLTPPATYGGSTATTTYAYDEPAFSSGGAGNLTSVSTPILSPTGASQGAQVTHYVHANSSHPGDVTSMVDPDGNAWAYAYDSTGDRISETAPATSDNSDSTGSHQNVTKWAYNTNTGWQTARLSGRYTLAHPTDSTCTAPATGCSTYTYDNFGRRLITTDPNGHTTQSHYDADGNRDYVIDGDAHKTIFTFDAAEQNTVVTRADTTQTKTNYWPDGTVEDQIDAANAATHYTYDPLGHLTGATDPDSRATGYTYDPVGNLVIKADPGVSGCTVSSTNKGCTIYTYDGGNERTGINYNDAATANVTFQYDGNGRRRSMTDGTGTSSWSYDSLGRVAAATDGASASLSYSYNNRGAVTSTSYPNAAGNLIRVYDAAGRESSQSDWNGNNVTFTYDADGNLTSGTDPTTINGSAGTPVVDAYTYDPADVVSGITTKQGTTTLASFNYTRDNANQEKSVASAGVPADSHSYGYNNLNFLTGVDTNSSAYGYDTADNPTAIAPAVSQTFDPANQLASATISGQTTTFGYDAKGERTSKTGISSADYSYDQAGRLTSYSLPTVSALAAGGNHSLALKSDGTVWSWGRNSVGQLGNGTTTNSSTRVAVTALTGVTAVAAGSYHSLALKSDGTVRTWGLNHDGQLGNGNYTNATSPVQVSSLTGVTAIAGSCDESLVLKSDGTVWDWGWNGEGELGNGTTTNSTSPIQVSGLTSVTAISAGCTHSLALKSDGTVWSWGDNSSGQLGNGTNTNALTPVQVSGLTGVVAIDGALNHSVALKSDGTVWDWGDGGYGQLGNGVYGNSTIPVQVSGLTGVTAVGGGYSHTLALKSDGTVWAWGGNDSGQLGNGQTISSTTAVQVSGLVGVTAIAGGGYHTLVLKADKTVWAWGGNAYGELGNGTTTSSFTPVEVSLTGVSKIAGGAFHSLAVKSDGTVWDWGYNGLGQLGNGTTTTSSTPVQVSGLTGATSVAGGIYHSLALKSDGTVRAWGNNGSGELGNGTNSNSSTAVQVSGLTGAIAIAAGGYHSLAIKSGGTVWAWGYNNHGQLGNGTTSDASIPVQVSGLTGVIAIAAGDYHSLALKSDGTVWAWGYNAQGELGNGTTSDATTPVQVTGLTAVTAIAGGFIHSLALKSDGTVWAWGSNGNGQLGNGTYSTSSTPVQATGLTGMTAIAGGKYYSVALKSDGSVWAWGDNQYGQLGADTSTCCSPSPAQVAGLTGVMTGVAAGFYHSVALKSDGTVWGWGDNQYGQLGTNIATSTTPVAAAIPAPNSATYRYNGDGLRTSKTVNGATSQFVWDRQASNPLLISDSTNYYIYGPDGSPLEQISQSNAAVTWYHHDQLGSTRVLTNAAGAVAGTATYDPYGNVTGSTGAVSTLGYAGQYTDTESGLIYLRARYYDPATAQFLTRDPLEAQTRSPYGYVNDNPLNGTDPSGLCGHWYDVACQATSAYNGAVDTVGGAVMAVGGAVDSAANWSLDHPWEAAGIALGAISLATGVGELAGATYAIGGLSLGAISFGTGLAGAALDYNGCFNRGSQYACVGLGLTIPGTVGSTLGVFVVAP